MAGYSQGKSNHIVFYQYLNRGGVIILIVYRDDIIITGINEVVIQSLKGVLSTEFEVKDIGKLKYFLGMEIAQSKEDIVVSHRKYTLNLLSEVGLLGSKPTNVPIDFNHKTGMTTKRKKVNKRIYQKLVGKLIYLSHYRSNISFSYGLVSQFMHDPMEEHLEALYQILRYLKKNLGHGFMFKKGCGDLILVIKAYTYRTHTSGWC